MAYSTISELKTRLGSSVSATAPGEYQLLTNRLGGTTGDDSVATAAILYADGRINSYVTAAGFATPVDSDDAEVNTVLNSFSLDIAAYHLWQTHPSHKTIPDRIQAAYDDAIAWLEGLAKGTTALPATTPLASSTADGVTIQTGGWTSVMTEDSLGPL
jgi:phage gp36-like protein